MKPTDFLRQLKFCENYIANGGHGAQAARDAGYAEANARNQAHRLLADRGVRARIEKRMKELADKVGLNNEYMLQKLKTGLDISIPSDVTLNGELLKNVDVRAGVACISEANKMLGNYAPEKKEHTINGKVDELVKEYEREY